MDDHLRDATKKMDFISREAALSCFSDWMGATIPWCTSKKTICEPHQCNGCQDFISKAEVHDVVSHILEERRADNG